MNIPPRTRLPSRKPLVFCKKGGAFLVWLLLACTGPSAVPAFATDYCVALSGNDTNAGTPFRPFRTIQKAVDVMGAGDSCKVREGIYRESVVMNCSGTPGKPVSIHAAPGEKVVIDGTEDPDLKWEKYRDRIYKAATRLSFRQLFFDGTMMFEARWPDMHSLEDLWSASRWAAVGAGTEYGKIVDDKLAATGIDMTGATAVLNVYHQFYTWTRPVKDHCAGSNSFFYEKDLNGVPDGQNGKDESHTDIKFADDRYYLTGTLALLDTPGEWYLDEAQGTLYFYAPDGTDPTGHRISVKQRDYGLAADRQRYLTVDGLTFFACGIRLEQCDDCLLENSTILHSSCTERERLPGNDPARKLESLHPAITGNRNTIRNNLFAYGSQTGLYVDGVDDVIENNVFHDFGWLSSLNHVALRFSKSWARPGPGSNCLIRHNTLFNTGGPVLHFNGKNITVEYNDIYNGMRAAFGGNNDVAMLYTQGDVTGSKAHCNWVHDSAGGSTDNTWGNGIGIRGDDNTVGYTVDHNVIWNVGACAIMMKNKHLPSPGEANSVLCNTTFGNSTMLKKKVDIILPMGADGENRYSTVFNNCAGALDSKWGGGPIPDGPNIGNNCLGKPPLLVDPANGDFRPAPGSPLIGSGKVLPCAPASSTGKAPDIGAYQAEAEEYWIPGCRTPAASRPIIPDRAAGVRPDPDLIWLQGYRSVSSDVYFGTSREAVEIAGPVGKEYMGRRKGNIFHPGTLSGNTAYYWRIDAVDGKNRSVKGPVWTFTTQ